MDAIEKNEQEWHWVCVRGITLVGMTSERQLLREAFGADHLDALSMAAVLSASDIAGLVDQNQTPEWLHGANNRRTRVRLLPFEELRLGSAEQGRHTVRATHHVETGGGRLQVFGEAKGAPRLQIARIHGSLRITNRDRMAFKMWCEAHHDLSKMGFAEYALPVTSAPSSISLAEALGQMPYRGYARGSVSSDGRPEAELENAVGSPQAWVGGFLSREDVGPAHIFVHGTRSQAWDVARYASARFMQGFANNTGHYPAAAHWLSDCINNRQAHLLGQAITTGSAGIPGEAVVETEVDIGIGL